jgi:hypothetical protein
MIDIVLESILKNLIEILTLLIAMSAIVTAILSYRYRPSKLDVERKHSEDLKKNIIQPWLEQIRNANPSNPYEYTVKKEYKLNLQIENELYFDDMKNHLPSELKLMKEWEEYKSNWETYEKERFHLFLNLKDDLAQKLGLTYDNRERKENFFTLHLIKTVLTHMRFLGKENEMHVYPTLKIKKQGDGTARYSDEGFTVFRGSKQKCDYAHKEFEKFIANLEDSTHQKKLIEIKKQYDYITKQREELIKKIRFVEFIPLIPGKCKYIKWSLPGIVERIKKRL